ncbi:MAG: transporter substrate-binding domain-containing protein [Casimicrobium sp.]
MNFHRRSYLAFATAAIAAAGLLLSGCGTAPAASSEVQVARAALVPTGALRIGVYPGSPTSMVRDAKTGEKTGIAYELGAALARDLGVRAEHVEFRRLAEVIDALKAGQIDFTFTNASPARAKDLDFTPALVQLELGYLVPNASIITAITEIDRPGVRVGVSEGSSSFAALSKQFTNAKLVTAPSLQRAGDMLVKREIDAFATNKGILFELADSVPNTRILAGRWGVENIAIGIPKGRAEGLSYVQKFAQRAQADGTLAAIVKRSGLRGVADRATSASTK